ncbi:MAG: hypothetical protein PUP93_31310 [Rhizonema sp. NSF051]|nr:hypothetical protein [Rhizonema sp. NSF051]
MTNVNDVRDRSSNFALPTSDGNTSHSWYKRVYLSGLCYVAHPPVLLHHNFFRHSLGNINHQQC